MDFLGSILAHSKKYVTGFAKWLVCGIIVGLVGGTVGVAFHMSVEYAAEFRDGHIWLIWLLPVGGLLISALYSISHVSLDTNIVIRAVQEKTSIHWLMAPLIFICSVISHFFGASVGREGAALQIGGTIGYRFGKLFRLDESDVHIMVMCGMSAVFAAVFGTPITAVFFALEVSSVGIMYYAGLLPCITAALIGTSMAKFMGIEGFDFVLNLIPTMTIANILRTAVLGIACAVLAIVFCTLLHRGEKLSKRFLPNSYIRIFLGGLVIALATFLLGTTDYNGAGTGIIYAAIGGSARPEAFIIKMLFTVICVCVGYKGGEIIPTLFIGATFGCVVGPVIGMDAGFAAAICFVALFCAMVNCPIASVVLSIELFGAEALPMFALACVISYMLSGSYSLYLAQSFVYSKVKALYVNKHTR